MNQQLSATRVDDILKLLPRNFLSLTVFKWTLPISLVLAVISTPVEINSAQEVLKWLFIGFCGYFSLCPLWKREEVQRASTAGALSRLYPRGSGWNLGTLV